MAERINTITYGGDITVATATIASGASQSDVIDTQGHTSFMLLMPSAWTTAHITFLVSDSPTGTFLKAMSQNGTELDISVAAGGAYALETASPQLCIARYIKLRSGTASSPVNQAAERTIKVIMRG